ncbi:putative Translation initiation factor IF-2 [Streptomyces afghaniensis 772]|uniref:Putative Translation initiation factor IF-2 n=1 Tax=Streptomyces afghaniensis 772 TaxID=1283301 RepID=S4MNK3_9ACTN|nr:putative Translation initiation factor IF-2 [Streptomyces afghaniensis 772]
MRNRLMCRRSQKAAAPAGFRESATYSPTAAVQGAALSIQDGVSPALADGGRSWGTASPDVVGIRLAGEPFPARSRSRPSVEPRAGLPATRDATALTRSSAGAAESLPLSNGSLPSAAGKAGSAAVSATRAGEREDLVSAMAEKGNAASWAVTVGRRGSRWAPADTESSVLTGDSCTVEMAAGGSVRRARSVASRSVKASASGMTCPLVGTSSGTAGCPVRDGLGVGAKWEGGGLSVGGEPR